MPKAKAALNICVRVLQSASAAMGTSKPWSEPHLTIFALHQFRLRHRRTRISSPSSSASSGKAWPPRRSEWRPSQQGDSIEDLTTTQLEECGCARMMTIDKLMGHELRGVA
jgi:hypothetical protein